MKRAVLTNDRVIDIVDQDIPDQKDKVLIKVKYVGICESDILLFNNPSLRSVNPLPLGHEISGIVAEDHDDLKEGDRVFIDTFKPCYSCTECSKGMIRSCNNARKLDPNGSFAEYITVDPELVNLIPRCMSLEEATLIEPFSIGSYSRFIGLGELVKHYLINYEDISMLSIGLGSLGILTLLSEQSIKNKYGIDDSKLRQDIANGYGICLPDKHLMFDLVFNAYGSIDLCTEYVKDNGVIVVIGLSNMNFDQYLLSSKGVTVTYVNKSNFSLYSALITLRNLKLDLKNLITHRFKLDDIQEAFELASDHRDRCLKVLIEC